MAESRGTNKSSQQPEIEQKQQQYQGHNAIRDKDRDIDEFDDMEQKNEKRKRKRKKLRNKHPPEYYQQVKREKQMRKRQSAWDGRFNMGSIPNFTENEVIGFRKVKTRTKLKNMTRDQSPKTGIAVYKTFNADNNKTKPSKSFNIRIMSKKQQKQQTKHQKKQNDNQVQKQKAKKDDQILNLIQQVNKTHKQYNFVDCHRDLLVDIIKKSKQKIIKSFIHSEIDKLKNKTSNINVLENLIQKREDSIKQLQNAKQQQLTLQNIQKYRLSTLKVIQQILKWKDEWQTTYHELTKIKPKLVFKIKNQNYLHKIYKGVNLNLKNGTTSFEKNPFLLGCLKEQTQNKLIVKIRACQMLLLEQIIQKDQG